MSSLHVSKFEKEKDKTAPSLSFQDQLFCDSQGAPCGKAWSMLSRGSILPPRPSFHNFSLLSYSLLHTLLLIPLINKNSPAKAGDAGDVQDAGSIPGSGRSHGEGNGNPLKCSCLLNPIDRGA